MPLSVIFGQAVATALLSELNRALARSQGKDAFSIFLMVQKIKYFFSQDGSDNGVSDCYGVEHNHAKFRGRSLFFFSTVRTICTKK